MTQIKFCIGIMVALEILTAAHAANAPGLDLDSCHDDLDRVRRTASDASGSAEDAKSKSDDFEACRRDPESHDRRGDGCSSRKRDYESALSDLESKMDDLDGSLRSVQSSCGYEFSINRVSSLEAAQRRLCASYKRLVGVGITPENVLQTCKTGMDLQWCKSCLGLK